MSQSYLDSRMLKIDDVEVNFTSAPIFSTSSHSMKFSFLNKGEESFLFVTILLEPENESTSNERSRLNVNYKDITSKQRKPSDRDILIARFIDRFLRPTIYSHDVLRGNAVSINILGFRNPSFDITLLASLATIITLRSIIPIDLGVCRIRDNKIKIDMLVCTNKDSIIAIEMNSQPTDQTVLNNLLNEAYKKCNHLIHTIEGLKLTTTNLVPIKNIEALEEKEEEINRVTNNTNMLYAGVRADNRKYNSIRPISIQVLSKDTVIFSRGATSVLSMITQVKEEKKAPLTCQYIFNSFATGEISRNKSSASRREIGHSELIRRSLIHTFSDHYLQATCEVLSCDGSSSMASTSATSIALYLLGYSTYLTAGLSFGLVSDGTKWKVLTDLTAKEDEISHMDLKLAASTEGITAIQMDIKQPVPFKQFPSIIKQAFAQIQALIGKIQRCIKQSHKEKSKNKIIDLAIQIEKERVGLFIGSNGSNIQQISQITGSSIKVNSSGEVKIKTDNSKKVIPFVTFYGFNNIPAATRICFIAKKDFDGKLIETSIGNIKLSRNMTGKRGDIIEAYTKEGWTRDNDSRNVQKVKINSTV